MAYLHLEIRIMYAVRSQKELWRMMSEYDFCYDDKYNLVKYSTSFAERVTIYRNPYCILRLTLVELFYGQYYCITLLKGKNCSRKIMPYNMFDVLYKNRRLISSS